MKTLFTLLLAALAFATVAQPQKINYQALALGSNGKPLKNTTVSLRLSVLDSAANGTVLYTETQPATTDAGGLFSVHLGTGTPTAGTFASLPWANGNDKFLKVEMDAQGGTNYQVMGTTQLVSVPFAFSSGVADLIKGSDGKTYQLTSGGNNGPSFTCYPPVSKSNAGPDQLLVSGISVVLNGTIPNPSLNPSLKESGKWTIISGGGGQIVTNSLYNSTFLGKMDSSYLLTWTIQNYCGSSTDTVVISFQGNGWLFNNGCPGGSQVNYSGQIYPTIQIGTQCWFQKNLNIGTQVFHIEQTNNAQIEKYCYDNDPLQCDTFGGLYQWAEAVQYQNGANNTTSANPAFTGDVRGICPAGWHVPSKFDWCRLVTYLDNNSNCNGDTWSTIAGGALKTTNLWNPPNVGATNVSKFSALPGGFYRILDSTFGLKYQVASFWSSQDLGSFGGNINFYSALPETGTYPYKKRFGFSIRCINDTSFSTTAANAGADQWNIASNRTTLAANTPATGEIGTWTITTGSGATLSNANDPSATFTKGTDSAYTLVWTITGPLGTSQDTVNLLFAAPVGTACGQAVSYAGESYPTVQIGTQCWFAKNLNVGTMINSSASVDSQTNNAQIEKYCYDNDPLQCDTFGGLYQWAEAVQYQNGANNTTSANPAFTGNVRGICPTGWHLPSDAEYCTLTTFLDATANCNVFGTNSNTAGGALKATSGLWTSPNTGATNSSGFSALPGGSRHTDGTFGGIGLYTYFWSSSESSSTNAFNRNLFYFNSNIYRDFNLKDHGFSARCTQD